MTQTLASDRVTGSTSRLSGSEQGGPLFEVHFPPGVCLLVEGAEAAPLALADLRDHVLQLQ